MDSHTPLTPYRFDSADIDAARRELARRHLVDFAEYTNPLYRPAEHHRRICKKLEAVERGEIDRLMIFMPPRHGKSELASKRCTSLFWRSHFSGGGLSAIQLSWCRSNSPRPTPNT